MSTSAEQALRDELTALRAEVKELKRQQPVTGRGQHVLDVRNEGRREVPLAPAPREVPPGAIASAFFGGTLAVIGYITLAFSSIFVVVFPLNSELVTPFAFMGPLAYATGKVLRNEYTAATIGGRMLEEYLGHRSLRMHTTSSHELPVMGVRFSYTVGGIKYEGVSYATGQTLSEGMEVDVEYKVWDPNVARIEGMRYKLFPSMVAFVLVFPLIGLGLILPRLLDGSNKVRLYSTGIITHGTLVDKRPTGTVVNGVRMMALTFHFQLPPPPPVSPSGGAIGVADGGTDATGYQPLTYQVVHHSLRSFAVEDEVWEPILVDPSAPASNAELVDGLDGVFIDDSGQFRAHPSSWLYACGPIGLIVFDYFLVSAANAIG